MHKPVIALRRQEGQSLPLPAGPCYRPRPGALPSAYSMEKLPIRRACPLTQHLCALPALQDKIQNSDGSMVIDTRGPLPPNTEMPGEIRYADGSSKKVALPTAAAARQPRPTPALGSNLYSTEQQLLRSAAQEGGAGVAAVSSTGGGAMAVGGDGGGVPAARGPPSRQATGTEELSFLASLLGACWPPRPLPGLLPPACGRPAAPQTG